MYNCINQPPYSPEPISHGRTLIRNIKREEGYLTYPSNTLVTVFAKNVGNDDTIWEGEVSI